MRYLRRSDVVARESEPSSDDLTHAEPSVQLDPKQCRDTSMLDVQVLPVPPQELCLVKLFPECFIATRKAARNMCQYSDVLTEDLSCTS